VHLLHISDPTLPIGAYTHSNGLETFVQKNMVHDHVSAKAFIENMIKYNLKFNDGAFVRLAYEATTKKDIADLVQLDLECSSIRAPRELRLANQKLGLRFVKIFKRRFSSDFTREFELQISENRAIGNYPIVFGLYAVQMGVTLSDALFGFYYSSLMGLITNAVKLVPLGQMHGQDILFDLYALLEKTVEETIELDRNFVGLSNCSFDIRSMQHERLYSRLYMS